MQKHSDLEKLIKPVIEKMGYSFAGLEYVAAKKSVILRIYIDQEFGITTDDCKRVSYQINQLLKVEIDEKDSYTLEISSPGMDRTLYSIEQCVAHVGQTIKVNLAYPIAAQRNFTGVLQAVKGQELYLNVGDDKEIVVNFEDIGRAKVVPEW